eukprot:29285_1
MYPTNDQLPPSAPPDPYAQQYAQPYGQAPNAYGQPAVYAPYDPNAAYAYGQPPMP